MGPRLGCRAEGRSWWTSRWGFRARRLTWCCSCGAGGRGSGGPGGRGTAAGPDGLPEVLVVALLWLSLLGGALREGLGGALFEGLHSALLESLGSVLLRGEYKAWQTLYETHRSLMANTLVDSQEFNVWAIIFFTNISIYLIS